MTDSADTATETDNAETESAPKNPGTSLAHRSKLVTEHGTTTIAAIVVAKIAQMAASAVPGVYRLGGTGVAGAIGTLRDRIPGQWTGGTTQGVVVEVGERQAACDLVMVAEYGVSIHEVAGTVRENIRASIEEMTGLEVTEVNIAVEDIHLPNETTESDTDTGPRVQ